MHHTRTTTGQQRDNPNNIETTAGQHQRDNPNNSGTPAGQQRDNLGTTSGHPEREPHKHTRTSFFPQLLSLHDLADSNFNLCSTLSASGQPLTPVSMPAPQDAADDHAARGGFAPRRASSAGHRTRAQNPLLCGQSRIPRPVTACSTGQARLNTKRADSVTPFVQGPPARRAAPTTLTGASPSAPFADRAWRNSLGEHDALQRPLHLVP